MGYKARTKKKKKKNAEIKYSALKGARGTKACIRCSSAERFDVNGVNKARL